VFVCLLIYLVFALMFVLNTLLNEGAAVEKASVELLRSFQLETKRTQRYGSEVGFEGTPLSPCLLPVHWVH
jgi:hypothetical protein